MRTMIFDGLRLADDPGLAAEPAPIRAWIADVLGLFLLLVNVIVWPVLLYVVLAP